MSESQDHNNYIAYLKRKNLFYDHCRTDKRTTNRKGWPDFQVMEKGRSLFVELKKLGNKLSPDQIKCKEILQKLGFCYALCYGDSEAIHATELWLSEASGWMPLQGHPSRPLDCQGISGGGKGKADVR